MFIDEATVEFVSGDGGSGAVSFHREKHVPRGGPNGADGGKGGDITLVADRGKRTLYDLQLKGTFRAESGAHALGNKRGRDGKSIEIKVPVGTVITDASLEEKLVDLNAHGMKYVIGRGGKGGFGNLRYVSSVRQVPNFAQKGAPGEKVIARLELKLLADVGLVGLPNAGKSTLLSRISAAKPKIADYPFTTIEPNLGVVQVDGDTFVAADMPGLIEGASEGVGLGHQFLRHVQRTKVLIHVVDAFPIDGSDPIQNLRLIDEELERYGQDVSDKPRLVALNKIDLAPLGMFSDLRARFEKVLLPLFPISGVTGEGIQALLYEVHRLLKESEESEPIAPILLQPQRKADDDWDVVLIQDAFEITGRRIRRMVAMTDLKNKDAVRYLHRRLQRIGVIDKLRELGAEEEATVYIGDYAFSFTDEH